MPPHIQIDQHDELQEAPLPSQQCLFLNDTNNASEQSPLFQDDLSSRASASPLDALRNDDDTICDDSVAASGHHPVKKPEVKRISGIEAIIGSESRYAQNEIAANRRSSVSSSSTVATASTSSKASKSSKVNSVLPPNKDSKQRRKQIAGFFRKGKKIASSIVKKKKSKKNL